MATPILATKLYRPPLRAALVHRARLVERLNANRDRKLTLISAPVGFGKTTLVNAWVSQTQRPLAWLSLDEGDNDPTRFLTYLIAALQTIRPTLGHGLLEQLQAAQPQPQLPESVLATLLNEIMAVSDDCVLVLDDYHVINAKPIDMALSFLIERLPPQLHLVITTREDPHLPLARLRAQGHMAELRAADLRFTADEAAEFLNQLVGLTLSADDIGVLETRTEGWIAGLQLAALSMQGRTDLAQFVRAFAGDNRYIVDYLAEEVLQNQPVAVRHFLLQTAILDRLNGPLCDAVTGQSGSALRLEALERGNFFVVPLDDKRNWYRYHHLFGEVLTAHLKAEQPDQISMLHRRASEWYAQQGSTEEAIRHALAAKDFEQAAALVERAAPAMRQSRREATLLSWLKALPNDVLRYRPVLSVHYAGALLLGGQLDGVEVQLQNAEWALSEATDTDADHVAVVIVDQQEYQQLPVFIALYRAAQALAQGNVAATMQYARQALSLAPDNAPLLRGPAAGLLGLAYWTMGNLEEAHRFYSDCMARLYEAHYISDTFGCAIALADIRMEQGRLHEAMQTYEQAIQKADKRREAVPAMRGMADMQVGMSEICYERNDLNAAVQHLERSKALGEAAALPQNQYRWCVAMARVQIAQGDLDAALAFLAEAERVYVGDFFPNIHPIAALKARAWVAQGRLGEALHWVRERGLSIEDDLNYMQAFEHLTLARVLLAQANRDGVPDRAAMSVATHWLGHLLRAAEEGGRVRGVIEALVLLAVAHNELGDRAAALDALQRAVSLAEPEGYIRIFVDEGQPMMQMLGAMKAHAGRHKVYLQTLLAAFGRPTEDERLAPASTSAPAPASTPASESSSAKAFPPLVEPLSQRELEVLRLLKTELSGPEIARELVVALSTVRTYTKGIYGKLNVSSRRAAVRRGVELGLI